MNPLNKSDFTSILLDLSNKKVLSDADVQLVKMLFSSETISDMASSLDKNSLQRIKAKLIEQGLCQEIPLTLKIEQIATLLTEDFALIEDDLESIFNQISNDLQMLNQFPELKAEDRLIVRQYLNTNYKDIVVQSKLGWLAKNIATKALYYQSEQPKDVLNFLAEKREGIFKNLEKLLKNFSAGNTSKEKLEQSSALMLNLYSPLEALLKKLDLLKNQPTYRDISSLSMIEAEKNKVNKALHQLNDQILKVQELIYFQTHRLDVDQLKALTSSYLSLKEDVSKLSKESSNQFNLLNTNQSIKNFAVDLKKSALTFKNLADFTIEINEDSKFLIDAVYDIYGSNANSVYNHFAKVEPNLAHIIAKNNTHIHLVKLIGEQATDLLKNISSKKMFDSLLLDVKKHLNNDSLVKLQLLPIITITQFGQIEINFKMGCGIPSKTDDQEVKTFVLVNRSVQIPLLKFKNLIPNGLEINSEKFKVVDMISLPIDVKDVDFIGGYKNCLNPLLNQFNHKSWGMETGKMLFKTAAQMKTDGLDYFKKLLIGKEVSDLNDTKKNINYTVPNTVNNDLIRFGILRLNKELVYSIFFQDSLRNPTLAYEKIAKALGEKPDEALATQMILVALSQIGFCDSLTQKMQVDSLGYLTSLKFRNWVLDVEVNKNQEVIITNKAIVQEYIHQISGERPTDLYIVSRKLQMPIQELKNAMIHKDPSWLVNLKGEDKISSSLFIKKDGMVSNETPQLVNGGEHSFETYIKDEFDLLNHFE